jgi:hypothetical protein
MADELDLRASIEQAMDTDTGADAPVVDTKVDTPVDTSAELAPPVNEKDGKVRDGLGRFVSKAGDNTDAGASPAEKPAQAAPALDGGLQPPEIAPAPVTPPPVAWNATVREHWAALPPVVQQEIARRESAFTAAFREVAPQRELAQAFQQAIQPHMMAIQAEGVDPITAVTNLMQVGSRLRFGTPAEKAMQVAQIVKAYGVDIQALDGALVGAAPQPGQAQGADPAYVQQLVQQQLQPFMMAAQQRQQAAAQQEYSKAASEANSFAEGHEFYGDLRLMMADMIEVADRQGVNLSLDEAYKRASMLHPDVSRVILARQQGQNAQALTAAATRAKRTAVSVKGGAPVGNPEGREPSSVRDSIEAAIDAHSRF